MEPLWTGHQPFVKQWNSGVHSCPPESRDMNTQRSPQSGVCPDVSLCPLRCFVAFYMWQYSYLGRILMPVFIRGSHSQHSVFQWFCRGLVSGWHWPGNVLSLFCFFKIIWLALLVVQSERFHCNISIHTYNTLWSCLIILLFLITLPLSPYFLPFLQIFKWVSLCPFQYA
jgi:hypothetical protein